MSLFCPSACLTVKLKRSCRRLSVVLWITITRERLMDFVKFGVKVHFRLVLPNVIQLLVIPTWQMLKLVRCDDNPTPLWHYPWSSVRTMTNDDVTAHMHCFILHLLEDWGCLCPCCHPSVVWVNNTVYWTVILSWYYQ